MAFNTLCPSSMIICVIVLISSNTMAYRLPSFRRAMNAQQMNDPEMFMDPSFSAGEAPQGLDIVQTESRASRNEMVMAGPPLGSGTQGTLNQVQVSNGAGKQSQTGTSGNINNLTPLTQGAPNNSPNMAPVLQGPQVQNGVNNPNTQTDNGGRQNGGIQQSVSGSYMFNPGNAGSILQSPPGTGNSQFNNNMGSRNSMLNQFGGNGLSVDPSQFFRPKQNPDGSINGAAGNAMGPPTIGPMSGGIINVIHNTNDNTNNNNNDNNNNNANNNDNFNGMFGPPNFFMNPGSSFGQ